MSRQSPFPRDAGPNAVLEPVAQTLHAAAQRVLGETERFAQLPAIGDLRLALALVVAKDERAAFLSNAGKAQLEAVVLSVLLFARRYHRCARHPGAIVERIEQGLPSLFEQDQSRDAVRVVPHVVHDIHHGPVELARQPIDRLVGAFVRRLRPAPIEELDECTAEPLVFPAGLLGVGVQPREQAGKGLQR